MPVTPNPIEPSDAEGIQNQDDLIEQVRQLREDVDAIRRELDQLANRQKWFY